MGAEFESQYQMPPEHTPWVESFLYSQYSAGWHCQFPTAQLKKNQCIPALALRNLLKWVEDHWQWPLGLLNTARSTHPKKTL